jgi:sugar O-acyltransferase (sialic acid O-acetyltransferase NeuD family)
MAPMRDRLNCVTKDILILGASGTGLDMLDLLDAVGGHRCVGFLDDDASKQGTELAGLPVVGKLADAARWPTTRLVNALGSVRSFRSRPAITACTGAPLERFVTLIHPRAVVSPRATVSAGCLIYPGTVIGPRVVLGAHVIVLANSVVNHDTTVGDWTIISSGVNVSGRVRIGSGCYLGTGCALIDDACVGDGALIGMGAVVIREVPAGATVVGNPAHEHASSQPPSPPARR